MCDQGRRQGHALFRVQLEVLVLEAQLERAVPELAVDAYLCASQIQGMRATGFMEQIVSGNFSHDLRSVRR